MKRLRELLCWALSGHAWTYLEDFGVRYCPCCERREVLRPKCRSVNPDQP